MPPIQLPVRRLLERQSKELSLSPEDAIVAPAILLVDDNHTFVELVAEIVVGFYPMATIGRAGSGEEALDVLSHKSWDIVLLDYRLPDFDGLEVLAEIRKRLLDVAVVMVTGEGDESLAVDLFRMGAYDYLVKSSINAESLERTLGQVLMRRFLEEQAARDDLAVTSKELEDRSRALDTAYAKLRDKKEQLRLLSDSLETTVQEQTVELQSTTSFLNSVLDSATDHFIIACSPDGVILSFNRGAEALFLLSSSDVVGRRHFRTLFAEGAGPRSVDELLEDWADGLSPQMELLGVRGDGERFAARVSFSRLEGTQVGELEASGGGLVIVGSDVTHERALEAENREYIGQIEEANRHLRVKNEQILEATRLKNQFLANISHELRTPLNAIMGYSDLLYGGIYGALEAKQSAAVQGIATRAGDLLALINDILDLARIEAGVAELRTESFTIGELIADVVETGRVLAVQKHLEVVWNDQGAGSLAVHTDRQKLQQILLNLVNNGVKFTSQGSVFIESRPVSEASIEIAVRDSGIGIPEDQLDTIFDEFRQVDGTSTREYGGSGLGLTISKKFAHLLGGDLSVESELGEGSTFRLVFRREATDFDPARIVQDSS